MTTTHTPILIAAALACVLAHSGRSSGSRRRLRVALSANALRQRRRTDGPGFPDVVAEGAGAAQARQTKRAMTAIMFFFTLADTGGNEKLPLITIPAQ